MIIDKPYLEKVKADALKMPAMPTSSSGLASGTLWNDSGTVKIA